MYINTSITAGDGNEFYAMPEAILLSQHESVFMGYFNVPIIDWTLHRPTPAPRNKLMQLVADNNFTQLVSQPNSRTIYWTVSYYRKKLIENQKTKDNI